MKAGGRLADVPEIKCGLNVALLKGIKAQGIFLCKDWQAAQY